MAHQYDSTAKGLMMWANSELEHVGRIVGLKDKDLQYSYALSTVNSMAHLKDAIAQYVEKHPESNMREDLLVIHEKVIRVMKHLISDFGVNVDTIKAFNTRGVLSSMKYLQDGGKRCYRKTRKTRKTRKNYK
jgi:D-alanine-D-alanine ligase-like ATP-grasp enzyme